MGSPLEYLDAMADGLKGAAWCVLGPVTALIVGVALGEAAWAQGGAMPDLFALLTAPVWLVFINVFTVPGWICLPVEAALVIAFWMREERRRGLWFLLCMASAANMFALEMFVFEQSSKFAPHVERFHVIPIILLLATGVFLLGCYLLLRFRDRIGGALRLALVRWRRGRKTEGAASGTAGPGNVR
jgi:hypothetical protein